MDLESCECCGVVFDLDRIDVEDIYGKYGEIIQDLARWDYATGQYQPFANCPACDHEIIIRRY